MSGKIINLLFVIGFILSSLNLIFAIFVLDYHKVLFEKNVLGIKTKNLTMKVIDAPKPCQPEENFKSLIVPKEKLSPYFGLNNKFGIYIFSDVNEIDFAKKLVNSSGGDWGYVLIPYYVRDLNKGKWQEVFKNLCQKHLIPIIQLTALSEIPTEEDIVKSAQFLNSLYWPTKIKIISAYNETNDKKFWGGKIDPENYAQVLNSTINSFKSLDPNFFVLNGAFNASARNGSEYLDEKEYLIRMDRKVRGVFKKLDGWASHPYPQPSFSGDPDVSGRDSIRAYEWELSLLKNLFNIENLPIFITETGWAHEEGEKIEPTYLKANQVAQFFEKAFAEVWLPDERVVAITPFILKRKDADNFSWIDNFGNPYPQFELVRKIEKIPAFPTF